MEDIIENTVKTNWKHLLLYDKSLLKSIDYKLKDTVFYPRKEDIFRAFTFFDIEDTKLVILGQDPYPNSSADGLAFSSQSKVIPGSLRNIIKESGSKITDGKLDPWAKQGVLLLNTVLTVGEKFRSHYGYGWENITKRIIEYLSEYTRCIFLFMGKDSSAYEKYVRDKVRVIITGHPSPNNTRSGSFIGSGSFKYINDIIF